MSADGEAVGVSGSPAARPSEIVQPSPILAPKSSLPEAVGSSVGNGKAVGVGQKKVFPAKRKRRLKPSQEAFVKLYTTPGQPAFGNGTEAYAQSHPAATHKSAGVLASNALDNVRVQEAVREKIEGLGFDKDTALEHLVWSISTARTQKKLPDVREGVKVFLQATGQWVDRQELTSIDAQQRDAIRRVVAESLKSPN